MSIQQPWLTPAVTPSIPDEEIWEDEEDDDF